MTALGDLVQAHIARAPYALSGRRLAPEIGITPAALGRWCRGPMCRLPHAHNLRATARVLGVPYPVVLNAALRDSGYLDDDEPPAL